MRAQRAAGVLLHVTSLPGPYGVGDFGPAARAFAAFLARAGQRYWQVLPLVPTSGAMGDSPYAALSAFALDSLFVSPDDLVEEGWIRRLPVPLRRGRADRCAHAEGRAVKAQLLDEALGLRRRARPAIEAFREANADWVEDHALFLALRQASGGASWTTWAEGLRTRSGAALGRARRRLRRKVDREILAQALLDRQWRRLRDACAALGLRLIGDVPFYVHHDSADVWAHAEAFDLDSQGHPRHVGGVPPDAFSATGQKWGQPLYRWDVMAADGYRWWVRRIARNLVWFDLVRLDHFRGLAAAWRIPAAAPTAAQGEWVPGPGRELLGALVRGLPRLDLLAEDLGLIDAEVRELRMAFDLPGMRVLQFAFGDDFPQGEHLPHHHVPRSVVYPGTHDNDTARGWYDHAAPSVRQNLAHYVGHRVRAGEAAATLLRLASASVADLAVVPLQDHLGLGSEARMNRPGTARGNWTWRLASGGLVERLGPAMADLAATYGR